MGSIKKKKKKHKLQEKKKFEIAVNGTTFKRNYRKQVVIYDEPVSANIEITANGLLRVSILPYQTLINTESMKAAASHKLPNGKINNVNIKNISPAEWMHEFPTEGAKGKHKIIIKISGTRTDGKPITVTLKPLVLEIDDESILHPQEIDEDSIEHEEINNTNEKTVSWVIVSLKIGIFNLIMLLLFFLLNRYSSKIKQRISPALFEEKTDG